MDRERRIKELTRKYQERDGTKEQEAWDKAVQKAEREGSEASRGPVKPDPQVGSRDSSESASKANELKE